MDLRAGRTAHQIEVYAQDPERWGELGNTKMYERARLQIIKYRQKIEQLKNKLCWKMG